MRSEGTRRRLNGNRIRRYARDEPKRVLTDRNTVGAGAHGDHQLTVTVGL